MSATTGGGTSQRYEPTRTNGVVNGGVSFWFTQTGLPPVGEALSGHESFDVCIVGGGLTGLWTAYYLAAADPSLRIVVLEAEFVGFGASGRNGGWLSAELAGSQSNYAAGPQGQDGVRRLADELRRAVSEVIDVCAAEAIDADIVRSGVLFAARSQPQLVRMAASVAGKSGGETLVLSAAEFKERVDVAGVVGGTFGADCARVQPAKLVTGLAAVIRRMGVKIYEQTRVESIAAGVAVTELGRVHAPIVLRCLEGYTSVLAGHRRSWLPMNSAMVVTDPLTDAQWDAIGWQRSELLGDFANAYSYAQRTADGRIAMGGRGVPYRFASRTDHIGRTQAWTIEDLRSNLHAMFPAIRTVPLAHAWCGVLGVPRDWCASVGLDLRSGIGWAGGYVGSGLTATNLAGRTLCDLVLQGESDLTALPWTNRRVRSWEPEPFRWLGVKALYGMYRAADRREYDGLERPSRIGVVADRLSGR